MAGTSVLPKAAASLVAAPLTPAKNTEEIIFAWANPPGLCPTRTFAKAIILLVIPI